MKTMTLRRNRIIAVFILFIGGFFVSNQGGIIANAIDLGSDWTEHFVSEVNYPRAIYVADLDGDGDNDVVTVGGDWYTYGEVVWYENLGDCPHSWSKHIIDTLYSDCMLFDVIAIDLDNDSDVDIVRAAVSSPYPCDILVWYESNGGSPPSWTIHTIRQIKSTMPFSMGPSIAAEDVDDDGYVDIVWGGTDILSWFENDGSQPPSWTEHIIPSTIFLNSGTSIFAIDVDHDNDVDVVVSATGHGELAWYENSLPSWTEHLIYDYPSNAGDVFAADLDNDSDVDILSAVGSLNWFENDGSSPPVWTMNVVNPRALSNIHAIDIDNDSDVDVVGATLNGNVYLYENDGVSPPSWAEHHLGVVGSSDDRQGEVGLVFPIDLDRDTDIDIAAGCTGNAEWRPPIVWFENLFVYNFNFRITSISDVGNDQGRQVRVRWNRCCYDAGVSLIPITEYSLWRRIGEYKKNDGGKYPPGDWDFIKTVPACGESTYNTICPTLADSTVEGIYWSIFFIRAHTEIPTAYFDSNPDSGYSLDNIPPLPIQDLEISPDSWITLTWTVPGEYPGEQLISSYDIRYSTEPVGADPQAWWENAQPCSGEGFFSFMVGEDDSLKVATETSCHPEIYLAIRGLDERPNASEISNVVHYLCGDVTGDEIVNVGDVIYQVSYLYRSGPAPAPIATGDVNCDGIVNVGDIVYLVSYLYRNGPAPGNP